MEGAVPYSRGSNESTWIRSADECVGIDSAMPRYFDRVEDTVSTREHAFRCEYREYLLTLAVPRRNGGYAQRPTLLDLIDC
jgi:hypothetical protein